jgi:glycolate oxidase FAD binding subunit
MAERLRTPGVAVPGQALTALRVENLSAFVDYRCGKLRESLAPYGEMRLIDDAESGALWGELRQLSVLQGRAAPLWRISTKPRAGSKVVEALGRYMPVEAFYDWSGGLIWLEVPDSADAGATDIRRVIARHGGHATLIKADAGVRAAIEVFQPLDPGIDRLSRGLKASFDPAGVLNPGRMYAAV